MCTGQIEMGGDWKLSCVLVFTVIFVQCLETSAEASSQGESGLSEELHRILQQSKCDDGLGAVVAQQATELSELERFVLQVKREVQAMKKNHPAASSELEICKKYIQATKKYYQATEKYLQATETQLRGVRPKLVLTETELTDTKKELETTKAEHHSVKAELESSEADLQTAKAKLEDAKTEALAAKEKHDYTKTEFKATKVELESTKAELQSAKAELESVKSVKAELQSTKEELETAKTELQSVKTDLQLCRSELQDATRSVDPPELETNQAGLQSNTINDTQLQSNETSTANLCPGKPKDCQQIQRCNNQSGVATIYPVIRTPVSVYCDQDTDGGGWTVIQRRIDGSEDFYKNWTEYQNGFGNTSGEYWLGLNYIYKMTTFRESELRVDLTMWNGTKAYATYSNFTIGALSDNYTLDFSNFTGGDAGDSLSAHLGLPFSTYDMDNDPLETHNCAQSLNGGWWYGTNITATNTTTTNSTLSSACRLADLNGIYVSSASNETEEDGEGYAWYPFGWKDGLKSAEMKLRPMTSHH